MKVLGLYFKEELNVLYYFEVCEYIFFEDFLVKIYLDWLNEYFNCMVCLIDFIIGKFWFVVGFNVL